jgi:hypothetical protein
MYRDRFAQHDVEACRHRSDVRTGSGRESATCALVVEIAGVLAEQGRVDRTACEACCRSFVPTAEKPNPVIASHVYAAAERMAAAGGAPGFSAERAKALREAALGDLPYLRLEDEPAGTPAEPDAPLATLVPPPTRRHGSVRSWAVGVTSAPRRRPTIEACLDSLARAGWDEPILFLDAVGVPARFAHLAGTARDVRVGAWPNYCLGLWELLLRRPEADAYLMVQDDALFADGGGLREYLEQILWPGESPCLVSLYTSSSYTAPRDGWRNLPETWFWGAVAFVFPKALALAFLTDPEVVAYRGNPVNGGLAGIDLVIGDWAARRGVEVWHPTPSLVQHIGTTSAIWSNTAPDGERRADRFVGAPESRETPPSPTDPQEASHRSS